MTAKGDKATEIAPDADSALQPLGETGPARSGARKGALAIAAVGLAAILGRILLQRKASR